ncbi:MAG TPA: Ig-like domain-containing protein, partial [Chthonomonadales bacterium]|nr:Ig-like domain-containing protein [Chthonomonadales bacterium]
MKRLACALVLIGMASALAISSSDARAAPRRAVDDIQLSIITPDPGSIGDRMSLDVSFRGSPVETIELYLDNALVAKRQLSSAQTRGIVTFTVDTVLLTEGAHEILVRAYSPTGKVFTARSKLRIPAADLTAPVRIAYPPNGIQVSGTVQIRAALDPSIQKLNPYVTFFVDKEFKSLRNFPPYEYVWDTTKVTNGWHMLEVWTTTGGSSNPFKARPTHVNVNNPTG